MKLVQMGFHIVRRGSLGCCLDQKNLVIFFYFLECLSDGKFQVIKIRVATLVVSYSCENTA
jgi:hypothetical protein